MQPYKNNLSMVTRSKVGIFKAKILAATCEPTCVEEALRVHHWKQVMVDELMALLKNNAWSLISLPLGRTPIGYKWVFKVKENPDGSIQKYKARLVAKGFHQVAGFDFTETFSPIVKPAFIQVMLTIALFRGWLIHQLDVNNAFLNGVLHEEVFMEQSPGFIQHNQSHLVC